MRLSDIRLYLSTVDTVNFKLPNGDFIPEHFHVTEVGLVTRHFIDCGGIERIEKVVNFQLWDSNDYDHRLKPEKLIKIIDLSQNKLGFGDLDIEVEYQRETVGKYDLAIDGKDFQLVAKQTACLATDSCGIPSAKAKLPLLTLNEHENKCTPGGGCC